MALTPEELNQKLKEARVREAQKISPQGKSKIDNKEASLAFKVAIELVSAVVVGGFLGYWIDQWLDSTPWGMIIMFILGFIAGFLNIYRAAMGQEFKIGFKKAESSETIKNDDEDNKLSDKEGQNLG